MNQVSWRDKRTTCVRILSRMFVTLGNDRYDLYEVKYQKPRQGTVMKLSKV